MSESLPRLLVDNYRAKKGGAAGLTQRQRRRLSEIVAFTRAHSPYYGEVYREVPGRRSALLRLAGRLPAAVLPISSTSTPPPPSPGSKPPAATGPPTPPNSSTTVIANHDE